MRNLRRLVVARTGLANTLSPRGEEFSQTTYASGRSSYAVMVSEYQLQGRWIEALLRMTATRNGGGAAGWTAGEEQHIGLMVCSAYTPGGFTENNYIAMFSVAANSFQLTKQVGGVETVLVKHTPITGYTLALDTDYSVRAKVNAGTVYAELRTADTHHSLMDSISVADSSYSNGFVGLHGYDSDYTCSGLRSLT